LEQEVPTLYDTLKNGSTERQQTSEMITKQMNEEFNNITQGIQDEKRMREEQEEAMLGMLKEIFAKVKDQLSVERQ